MLRNLSGTAMPGGLQTAPIAPVTVDLEPHKTIMSQYTGGSPRLNAIINSALLAWGVDWDFEQFLLRAWDIDSAIGYWLDCWGIIVGLSRDIIIPTPPTNQQFGFYQTGYQPFDQAPFASNVVPTTIHTVNDTVYRRLIKLKARANFGNGSPTFINKQLNDLFNPPGTITYRKSFVVHTGPMSMWFIFDNFVPADWELAVVMTTQIIPKPAGVWFGYADSTRLNTFGFNEAGYQPFDQAPFSTQI